MEQHFRHRIIRFFISSTFADMEAERDAIALIFKKLYAEYSSKKWTIEYIDLRWGVSKEASASNKTMRICLGELEKCVSISPRPNFIFLIGDRYGWIPLPELLSPSQWDHALKHASQLQREALASAYEFDANALPDGVYQLMPVELDSTTEDALRNLFSDLDECYNVSATEMEIRKGLSCQGQAADHVIGYMRSLKNVPDSLTSTFFDEQSSKSVRMKKLKEILLQNHRTGNILDYGEIDYHYFDSPGYIERFSADMEALIRKTIDREIRRNDLNDTQYQRQLFQATARSNSSAFYGRHAELDEITQFINADDPQYPKVIIAESGLGKSSFVSKVATDAIENSDLPVFPIFIGTGSQVSDVDELIMEVFNSLRPYFTDEGLSAYPYPLNLYKTRDEIECNDIYGNETTVFHKLDQMVKPGKYVILIDAIDRLHLPKSDIFNWLSSNDFTNPYHTSGIVVKNKFRNLRIIASFTPECHKKHASHLNFYRLDLEPFSRINRENFVINRLHSHNRTITTNQLHDLRNSVASCDQRGLYLDLTADFLAKQHSGAVIGILPHDLDGMAVYFLNQILDNGEHNCRFMRMTLAIILTSGTGLDHTTLNGVLACDESLVAELKRTSFHHLAVSEEAGLPPILISRLLADLSGVFLTMQHTQLGEAITIRHKELERILKEWLTPAELQKAEYLQYRYFRNAWKTGNRFAIANLVGILQRLGEDNDESIVSEMAYYLGDIDFVSSLISISRHDHVMKIYNGLIDKMVNIAALRGDLPQLRRLEALLNSLPERIDRDAFKSWCYNLPPGSWINRNGVEHNPAYMTNRLLEFDIDNAIVGLGTDILDRHNLGNLAYISGRNRSNEQADDPTAMLAEFLSDDIIHEIKSIRFSRSKRRIWFVTNDGKIIRFNIAKRTANIIEFPCDQICREHLAVTDEFITVWRQTVGADNRRDHEFYLHYVGDSCQYVRVPSAAFISTDSRHAYVSQDNSTDIINLDEFKKGNVVIEKRLPFHVAGLNILDNQLVFATDFHQIKPFYDFHPCVKESYHYIRQRYHTSYSGLSATSDGSVICVSFMAKEGIDSPCLLYVQTPDGWICRDAPMPYSNGPILIYASQISPDGSRLACAGVISGRWNIFVMRLSDGVTEWMFTMDSPIMTLSFSADGSTLVVADAVNPTATSEKSTYNPNAQFHVLELKTGLMRDVRIPSLNGHGRITDCNGFSLLPDGHTVMFDGLLFDLSTGKLLMKRLFPQTLCHYYLLGTEKGDREVRLFTRTGLVIGSNGKQFNIFDPGARKLWVAECRDEAIAVSPDATWIAFRTPESEIYFTDLSMRRKKPISLPANILSLMFHPEKKAFYVVTPDNDLLFCDLSGNILARALAPGLVDIIVSASGLAVIRQGGQISLFAPDSSILDTLPSWADDGKN